MLTAWTELRRAARPVPRRLKVSLAVVLVPPLAQPLHSITHTVYLPSARLPRSPLTLHPSGVVIV